MALPVPWMIRLGILFCRDCLSLEEASVRGVFPVGGSLKCWNRNTLSPTSLDCWPCYSPSLTSVLLLPFTFFLSSIFFFISVHFLIPNEQRVRGDGEPSLAPRSFRHHSPVFLHSQHESTKYFSVSMTSPRIATSSDNAWSFLSAPLTRSSDRFEQRPTW